MEFSSEWLRCGASLGFPSHACVPHSYRANKAAIVTYTHTQQGCARREFQMNEQVERVCLNKSLLSEEWAKPENCY